MASFEGDLALYYYEGFGGRSEPIRLLLTDAGVNFAEIAADMGGETRVIPANTGSPVFAPPAIQTAEGFCLGQTVAVLSYLGDKYGYNNEADGSPEGRAMVLQLAMDAADFLADAFKASGEDDAAVAKFTEKGGRMDTWFKHIAHFCNRFGTHGAKKQFAFGGDKPTFADFYIFSAVRLCRSAFGRAAVRGHVPKRVSAVLRAVRMRPGFNKEKLRRIIPFSRTAKGRRGAEDDGGESDDDDDDDEL